MARPAGPVAARAASTETATRARRRTVVVGQRLRPGLAPRRSRRAVRVRRRSRSTAPCGSPRRSAAGSGRRSHRRRRPRPRWQGGARAGSSCPGSGRRRRRGPRQLLGRVLDVEAGVERADADPHLAVGGEAPAVAGGHVFSGRSRSPGPSPPPYGCTSRPRDSRRPAAGRWRRRRARGASRARRRSAGADLAAVGVRPCRRSRPSTFAVSNSNVALIGQQAAQRPVVERRERPRQLVADGRVRACG